ncbi:hypothetical protein EZJ49_02015 [Bdellovibrio bacteriovorus]|uniref:hypothetical protein n=1 Tax=Bdellovibrio bacteriovorus TaxID=959 RepID=UPI0021CF72FA|nr:hypothetical protein [Bdellovibrio bacteriovorus]UXR65024.1 hypothetical protein EZJ49_02015 [Bdellovibrio bacteriovorus]
MKKFRTALILSVLFLAACNNKAGSGELDLGSLSEGITYQAQNEDAGNFHYVSMDLKANGDFEQVEGLFDSGGAGSKCSLKGTWAVSQGAVDSEVGNELVITVTELNGGAVSLEKRYELGELSAESLRVKLEAAGSVIDMTNANYVSYPEYQAAEAGLATDTFCDR